MALSHAEKKRRSRAKKPAKYHAHERETSRKRMAVCRAKDKAQKRVQQLKSLLSGEDVKEIEACVLKQKQHLLCDWFRHHNLKFEPRMLNNTKLLNPFMSKVELHKIELQLAEFEISIIEDKYDCGNNNVEFVNGLEPGGLRGNLAAESTKIRLPNAQVHDHRHGLDQVVLANDEITHFEKKEIASKLVEENSVINPTNARGFMAPSVALISREHSMCHPINAQGFVASSVTTISREISMSEPTDAQGFMTSSVTPISREIASTSKLAKESSVVDPTNAQGFMASLATLISRKNSMSDPTDTQGFMAPSSDPISVGKPADESPMIDWTNAPEIGLNHAACDMAPSLAAVNFKPQNSTPDEDQSTDPADSAPPSVHAFDSGMDEVIEAESSELLQMDLQDFRIENALEIDAECFGADYYLW